jgi:hypothetical protein
MPRRSEFAWDAAIWIGIAPFEALIHNGLSLRSAGCSLSPAISIMQSAQMPITKTEGSMTTIRLLHTSEAMEVTGYGDSRFLVSATHLPCRQANCG